MRQRDLMRSLFARYGNRDEVLIREYAESERRGDVLRAHNTYKTSPEAYARRLLQDARKKGWLRVDR